MIDLTAGWRVTSLREIRFFLYTLFCNCALLLPRLQKQQNRSHCCPSQCRVSYFLDFNVPSVAWGSSWDVSQSRNYRGGNKIASCFLLIRWSFGSRCRSSRLFFTVSLLHKSCLSCSWWRLHFHADIVTCIISSVWFKIMFDCDYPISTKRVHIHPVLSPVYGLNHAVLWLFHTFTDIPYSLLSTGSMFWTS